MRSRNVDNFNDTLYLLLILIQKINLLSQYCGEFVVSLFLSDSLDDHTRKPRVASMYSFARLRARS